MGKDRTLPIVKSISSSTQEPSGPQFRYTRELAIPTVCNMAEKASIEHGSPTIKSILLALDRSGYKEKIISYAITLAKSLTAEIIALHVIDKSALGATGDLIGYYRGGKIEEYEKEMKEVGERLLVEVEATIRKNEDIKVTHDVLIDTSVANAIINYAENKRVDLILIGARGTAGLEKFMLGGVANKVISHAHCPVLAIR
jgi:nucleotide-binding universal stress UspA family protein